MACSPISFNSDFYIFGRNFPVRRFAGTGCDRSFISTIRKFAKFFDIFTINIKIIFLDKNGAAGYGAGLGCKVYVH